MSSSLWTKCILRRLVHLSTQLAAVAVPCVFLVQLKIWTSRFFFLVASFLFFPFLLQLSKFQTKSVKALNSSDQNGNILSISNMSYLSPCWIKIHCEMPILHIMKYVAPSLLPLRVSFCVCVCVCVCMCACTCTACPENLFTKSEYRSVKPVRRLKSGWEPTYSIDIVDT